MARNGFIRLQSNFRSQSGCALLPRQPESSPSMNSKLFSQSASRMKTHLGWRGSIAAEIDLLP